MKTFLVIHHANVSARDMMAKSTSEQVKKGMQTWMAWAGKVQGVTVHFGSPVEAAGTVGPAGAPAKDVVGYSIYDAESADALKARIADHPHLSSPGGWLEVFEYVPMTKP